MKGYYNKNICEYQKEHVVEGLILKGYYNCPRFNALRIIVVEGLILKGYYNTSASIAYHQ